MSANECSNCGRPLDSNRRRFCSHFCRDSWRAFLDSTNYDDSFPAPPVPDGYLVDIDGDDGWWESLFG